MPTTHFQKTNRKENHEMCATKYTFIQFRKNPRHFAEKCHAVMQV